MATKYAHWSKKPPQGNTMVQAQEAERLVQGLPIPAQKKPVRKPKFTEDERKERNRQQALGYYRTHQEEYNRKKWERY